MLLAQHSHRGRRSGFTLIELLIVIVIIVILASMTTGALFRVYQRAKETQCATEISELSTALAAFKSQFGAYPPSYINLSGNDPASKQFISTCWPRLSPGGLGSGTLTGDEALVFFLGGVQVSVSGGGYAGIGFSTDPQNPISQSGDRIRPFYEFKSNRMIRIGGGQYCSYADPFYQNLTQPPGPRTWQPYLYFATCKGNDYTTAWAGNSCPGGIGPVAPYQDAANHFLNPDSFQIISAGPDLTFGPGGMQWTPGKGSYGPPAKISIGNGNGYDDRSNFYDVRLGIKE